MSFPKEVRSNPRTHAEIDAAKPIVVTVTLTNQAAALQLAQFCKRSTFDMFYDMTEAHLSHDEGTARAYQMIAGIEAVGLALANAGCDPR